LVYRSGLKVDAALGDMAELRSQFPEVETFAASIEASDVGIIRGSERGRAK
jgi:hypothetical protein